MNCFICGKSIYTNTDHDEEDHRMWFDIKSNKFAFDLIELFDIIYGDDKSWRCYALCNLDTNEFSITIRNKSLKYFKRFTINQALYWKNFKELRAYIDKIMVFE